MTATDPELGMSSLSLASRQVRPASRSSCRELVGFCHGLPAIKPAAASGFWVSGVAVLDVLALGAGHVALNQIPTISASAGVNACWASSAATTQTGS